MVRRWIGCATWDFAADWLPPESRGLREPVLSPPRDHRRLLLTMLGRPNLCSKEWIVRQYDHEVQGTSAVKHLVGAERDVPSDAVVLRPRLDSLRGLALTQALNPTYSRIDAYHMVACTIDEEHTFTGATELIRCGLKADGAIVAYEWTFGDAFGTHSSLPNPVYR